MQLAAKQEKVRVLIVDDSATIRGLLRNLFELSGKIEVVDVAVDALDAREKIKRYNPDVVTLDIEMPGMDGISFLEKIMSLRPMPVVMCSTLTEKGADVTLKALSIGACDFIAKPKNYVATELSRYSDDIISKVVNAASAKVGNIARPRQAVTEVITIEKRRRYPKVVAIGSSTGGTAALEQILTRMPSDAPPIVMAQHIPEGFATAFAKRVNEITPVEVVAASDGDVLEPGKAYIAPGGQHLRIRNRQGKYVCNLDGSDTEATNHKPSVDILFDSLKAINPKELVAVILTGMGSDGAQGMKDLHDTGVYTIAQDERSSVVYGMPKRAKELGAVDEEAALKNMAEAILNAAY